MEISHFRIFISSPGDVGVERGMANNLVLRLADEFAERLHIEPVYWEHEPLPATEPFQTKIPPSSECQVFVCILWSRLGTPLKGRFKRANGSEYESGTVFEYEIAFSGQQNGYPRMLVYRKTAKSLADLSDESGLMERLSQKKSLESFIKKWLHDEDNAPRASHQFETSDQFEKLLEEHLRRLIAEKLPAVPVRDHHARLSWKTGSPFRGLEVFDFKHAAVFFGRSKAVGEVLTALQKQAADRRAFVLVLGASGAGKSSLVRAGILPVLTQSDVIEGVRLWRWAVVTPGSAGGDLFASLASALTTGTALPELTADGTPLEELARQLREPAAASALIKGALSQVAALLANEKKLTAQPEARLALVVDQLEEIFTVEKVTDIERGAFIKVLSSLARSGRVWVLATLRSDFYHRCAELEELVALKDGAGQYDLVLPTAAEIGQMIKQPARAAGLWFEQDETTKIELDHVLQESAAANPESLPLLEFALQELYKRRTKEGALTWQAYRELGGVEGALATRADQVFTGLPPEVRAVLPEVFHHLVAVSDVDATVTRKQAAMAVFATSSSCKAFVDAFVSARLFTSDRMPDGSPAVRLAHEALLRQNWPPLTGWLDENRELLRVRDRVKASANRWNAENRPSDLLLPQGKPLEEALSLLSAFSRESDLSKMERDFIRASEKRATRWVLVKRLAFFVMALLTATAGVAATFAIWNAALAEQNAKESRQHATEAKRQLAEGLVSQGDALSLAGRCKEARDSLIRSHALFQELDLPAPRANLVLWDLYLNSPPELMTFSGHTAAVNCVALSADGRRALSGSADNTLKLWNVVAGNHLKTLSGHTLPVNCVCFSRDGRRALSGGADNTVRLWDIEGGKELMNFSGHVLPVNCVCFSHDGRRALSGGADNMVWLWDLQGGKEVSKLSGHTSAVNSMAFSPDGLRALSGSADNSLLLWDLASSKAVMTLADHTLPVVSVAFSPNGRTALSGSLDDTLKLWNIANGKLIKTVSKQNIHITSAVFSADGRTAVSADSQTASAGGADATLTLWDLEAGKALRTFSSYTDQVGCVALAADGRTALSGCADRTMKLLDLGEGEEVRAFPGHAEGVTSVALSPDGRIGVSGSADKTLKLWDLASGKELRTFSGHTGKVTSVAFSGNGRTVLSGSWDKMMKLWNIDTGKEVMSFAGHDDLVSGIAFSPDGRTALSGSEDRSLKLWDIVSGKCEKTFTGHDSGLTSVAFAPDGLTALSGSSDTKVKLWELSGTRELRSFSGHTSTVTSAAFSPDGLTALSGSADKLLTLWDLATGKALKTFAGHTDPVTCVAFSRDGLTALSGGEDQTLRLWDLASGKELRSFSRHINGVTSVTLSPDGRAVLSGSWDKTMKLWDFGRTARYIEFNLSLPAMQAESGANPEEPASLALLGNWYAFRGVDTWAVELLEKARTAGAEVSPLTLAKCYWKQGRTADAVREMGRAREQNEAPADYLTLCLQALQKPPGKQ